MSSIAAAFQAVIAPFSPLRRNRAVGQEEQAAATPTATTVEVVAAVEEVMTGVAAMNVAATVANGAASVANAAATVATAAATGRTGGQRRGGRKRKPNSDDGVNSDSERSTTIWGRKTRAAKKQMSDDDLCLHFQDSLAIILTKWSSFGRITARM